MAVAGQLKYGVGGGSGRFSPGKIYPGTHLVRGRSERFGEEVRLLFMKALGFLVDNLVTTQSTEHGVFTVIPRLLPVRTSRFSVFTESLRRQQCFSRWTET